MHFRVNEFEFGVNENIFSGNEQQKVLLACQILPPTLLKCGNHFSSMYLFPSLDHMCIDLTLNRSLLD